THIVQGQPGNSRAHEPRSPPRPTVEEEIVDRRVLGCVLVLAEDKLPPFVKNTGALAENDTPILRIRGRITARDAAELVGGGVCAVELLQRGGGRGQRRRVAEEQQ
ncbi:MAG: hypothetical protein ACK55Z_09180, partial [bacterium]